jgi:hypothetical protein
MRHAYKQGQRKQQKMTALWPASVFCTNWLTFGALIGLIDFNLPWV